MVTFIERKNNMSKNDEKILALRTKVEEKKTKLKTVRFQPETNCSLELFSQRYNINTLQKQGLEDLLVILNALMKSAGELKIKYNISGYGVDAWMFDIRQRLDMIQSKEEAAELKSLEAKLEKLLSNDKKTELEIDNIAKLLEE